MTARHHRCVPSRLVRRQSNADARDDECGRAAERHCTTQSSTMEVADIAIKPVRDFAKDSIRLVKKCTKPSADEFWKIAARTATGFVIMGFVGFFVKLVFIPINNIILSA